MSMVGIRLVELLLILERLLRYWAYGVGHTDTDESDERDTFCPDRGVTLVLMTDAGPYML